ncbi:hypothetical protein GOBAR_DD31299 [Gossypium barbadense]|nr:hypothetical protein GOBAR_DD31299 [Gossypium barbadense]
MLNSGGNLNYIQPSVTGFENNIGLPDDIAEDEEVPNVDVDEFRNQDLDEFSNEECKSDQVQDFHDFPQIGQALGGMVIQFQPTEYLSTVDPNVAHAIEFSEYLEIVLSDVLPKDREIEELRVGLQYLDNESYVYAIKYYNLKVSVGYKAIISNLTLYMGEC